MSKVKGSRKFPAAPTSNDAELGSADRQGPASASHDLNDERKRFSKLLRRNGHPHAQDTDERGARSKTRKPSGEKRHSPSPVHASAEMAPAAEKTAGTKDNRHSDEDGNTQQNAPLPGLGDQILKSLAFQTDRPQDIERSSDAPALGRLSEIADRLAERILVTDPLQAGKSEVRIKLQNSVLGGTEIMIGRDQGQIVVNFNVASEQAGQTLSQHAGDLQQMLSERLHDDVRVEVHTQTDTSGGGGQGGAQGDGRSRNRRDARDEWNPDDGQE